MVKLIIQKNKNPKARYNNNKKFSLLIQSSGLFLWSPFGILGFVVKGAAPLVRKLGRRWLEGFFFFFLPRFP
jgi:hypothetical protein